MSDVSPRADKTRLRVHRSTWVVAAFVLLLGTIVNLGPDYNETTHLEMRGFPWVYMTHPSGARVGSSNSGASYFCLRWGKFDDLASFDFKMLAGNAIVSLTVAIVLSLVWDRRCRKCRRTLQFTIRDGFIAVAATAAVLTLVTSLYQDLANYERLMGVGHEHDFRPAVSDELSDEFFPETSDIPFDWFWELSQLPSHRQPRTIRRLQLSHRNARIAKPAVIDDAIKHGVLRFPNLETLEINGCELSPSDLKVVTSGKRLHTTALSNCELSDEHLNALPTTLSDLRLTFFGNSPSRLGGLGRLTSLEHLTLYSKQSQGHDTNTCDATMSVLAALPKLDSLKLYEGNTTTEYVFGPITSAGWAELAKSDSLRYLTLGTRCLKNDDLRVIMQLRNWVRIDVSYSSVTDDFLRNFSVPGVTITFSPNDARFRPNFTLTRTP